MSAVANFLTLLRQEEEECSEILRAVRRQYENLLAGSINAILSTGEELERKAQALGVTRQQRDMAQQNVARVLQSEVSFVRLIPALPDGARAEVEMIVDRTNEKLLAIKSLATENEGLARTSLESTEEGVREVQIQQVLQKL